MFDDWVEGTPPFTTKRLEVLLSEWNLSPANFGAAQLRIRKMKERKAAEKDAKKAGIPPPPPPATPAGVAGKKRKQPEKGYKLSAAQKQKEIAVSVVKNTDYNKSAVLAVWI